MIMDCCNCQCICRKYENMSKNIYILQNSTSLFDKFSLVSLICMNMLRIINGQTRVVFR